LATRALIYVAKLAAFDNDMWGRKQSISINVETKIVLIVQ